MHNWVDFAAVKRRVSLAAVLQHYRVAGLQRRGDQLQGPCPIHRGQRRDSFRASLSKNAFQCFACQAQGNVLDFVAAMEKCSIRGAAQRLQQWFGVEEQNTILDSGPGRQRTEPSQLVREKEGRNLPLPFRLTGLDYAHAYLQQRGIDARTAAEFGVGFYKGPGLMQGRIAIPIRNPQGRLVAYAGRAIGQELPKYKLPWGFRKSLEIFHLDSVLGQGHKAVILVEGYFDCMRVHQAGLPGVALMGSTLSGAQEQMLIQHFNSVIILLDGDRAGREASARIAARLSGTCMIETIHLPNDVQPDQLTPAAIRQLAPHLGGLYTGGGCVFRS